MSEDERALRVFGVFVGLLDVSKRRGCCGRYGRIARCASVWAHSFLGRVSREFETRTVRARSGKRSGFNIERSVCSCAFCLVMRGTCAPFFFSCHAHGSSAFAARSLSHFGVFAFSFPTPPARVFGGPMPEVRDLLG